MISGAKLFLFCFLCQAHGILVRSRERQGIEKKLNATFTVVEIGLKDVNFRGLAIHDSSVWLGGSAGFVARLKGKGQMHGQVEMAKEYELRDVAVFDEADIIMMGSGPRARIFRYIKETGNFTAVYENNNTASFLNSMDFWDDGRGVAFGDSIEGKIMILLTDDAGKTWREAPSDKIPRASDGEVGFAASGTSLVTSKGGRAWIGLGGGPEGSKARVLLTSDYGASWTVVTTTMDAGRDTAGIFSLVAAGEMVVAVGGDFSLPRHSSRGTVSISRDGGQTWAEPNTPTHGYRSCVVWMGKDKLLAVGTDGLDFSEDGGENWENVKKAEGEEELGWNSISLDIQTGLFWIVGAAGAVVKLRLEL